MHDEYEHILQQSTLSRKGHCNSALSLVCQKVNPMIKSSINTHSDCHISYHIRAYMHAHGCIVISFSFFLPHTAGSSYQHTGEKDRQKLAFRRGLVGLGSEVHSHSTPLYYRVNLQPQCTPLLILAFSSPTSFQSVNQQELF